MAIFLACTFIGSTWSSLYVPVYALKTLVVALALYLLWPRFTALRWNYWWVGILVGIAGFFQWVGMQLYLQQFEFFAPSPGAFDPYTHFGTHSAALWAFLTVRIAGAVLVVPVMEELFWRDFVWRTIVSENFKQVGIGVWGWAPFLGVAFAFSTVHGNWWLTSIVWALMIGVLVVKTKSLGACILAHATTNLLLAAYVICSRQFFFW